MLEILSHLDLEDWFSFECVCRRWRRIASSFQNKPPLVITKVIEGKTRKWHTKQPCSLSSTIVRSSLQFDPEHTFLTTVRQLKIRNRCDDRHSARIDKLPLLTDFNFINRLACLEVLEIEKIDFEQNQAIYNETLTLPNLQHLTINDVHSNFKLDTPSLTSYKTRYLNDWSPTFLFPEKITRLYLTGLGYRQSLGKFENLEYLNLKQFEEGNEKQDCLIEHPSLKMLSIRPNIKNRDKNSASALRLLEKKKKLDKSDLKIIFFGFELDHPHQLTGFDCSSCFTDNVINRFQLLEENQSKLVENELRFIKEVGYFSTVSLDEPQIDLYRKLSHVERIYIWEDSGTVYTPEKVDEIIEFLKNFKKFNSLIYEGPHDLGFFEKLLANFPLLSSLDITFLYDASYSLERRSLIKGMEAKIKKLIAQFKHLYKHNYDFYYEDTKASPYDCVGETFEYYGKENDYPYKVKKLQYFRGLKKTARYELYVLDRNSSEKFEDQFGDYSSMSDLTTALYENYGD